MQKKALLVGFVLVVGLAICANAYAGGASCCDGGTCPLHGFFNSVGGFLYNAMPWNWGNWMGQSS